MAGAAAKLKLKPGTVLWSPDPGRLALLGALPDGVSTADQPEHADAAFLFADDAAAARAQLDALRPHLARFGVVWVAYPKGNRSDINRDSLWPILAEDGLRPNYQVAIDDTWSGLRFRPAQQGEAPFTSGR